ncbi:MAG: hypothetical protein ABI465_04655 [Ktedonobacteraceae bacterium]
MSGVIMVLEEAMRRRLAHILAKHPFLRQEALRRALLINAGLSHLLERVPPKASASVFLHLLLAELLTNLDAVTPGESWLISLLIYVIHSSGDEDLLTEDRHFLQQIVQHYTDQKPFERRKELSKPASDTRADGSSTDTPAAKKEVQERYLRHVIRHTRFIDITGLPSHVVQQSVPLDEVFLPLRLRPNRPLTEYPLTSSELQEYERRLKNQLPLKDLAHFMFIAERSWYEASKSDKTISIDEFWQLFTPERPAAILQGYPGMGKSTLVKCLTLFMARRCLKQSNRALSLQLAPSLVPFMIQLGDYAARRNDMPDLSLLEYLKYALDRFNIPGLSHFLKECLNAGKSLVLLDGLDEVSDPRLRFAIQDEIRDFILIYSDALEPSVFNRFLVTTRVAGYDQAAFPRYPHYTIAELTPAQIDLFLPRWSQAIVRLDPAFTSLDPGTQTQTFQREVQRRTEELRASIRERSELQTLVENPLLLTLLAVMQQNNVAVPRQRVELYHLFTQTLIMRRNRVSERSLLSEEQIMLRLGAIAWHMQETGNGFAHKNEVMASLIQTVEQEERGSGLPVLQEAEAFLHKMRVQVGLFVFRAGDYYGFLHRTFQEYFAARYILTTLVSDPGKIAGFVHNVFANYSSWREPFLLAVAHASKHHNNLAHEMIRTLLLTPTKEMSADRELRLRLAAECIIDAGPFAIDPRIERYVAEQLVHTYQKMQNARHYEGCSHIEDIMRHWLQSLPYKESSETVLAVLRDTISNHQQPVYQRAVLTLLALFIEQITPCSPAILSTLLPPLLALTGLPAIGSYQPTPSVLPSSDLVVADLALTILSLLGIYGPGGMLVASVRRHFDDSPEQLRLLVDYSLESRVLLTPIVIPKKDEGSEEWPGDISLRRWQLLLDQHREGYITKHEVQSSLAIHQALLSAAEEVRYPLTLHLLALLTEAQRLSKLPWKDMCQQYLEDQLLSGHYISYQECVFFWCTLFPNHQDVQSIVALIVEHFERDNQPIQRFAQRFLATLADCLLALDDLQSLGEAASPDEHFLDYLRYWLDIRELRFMQDPREVRYLRFLRDMHTLQNLRAVQGEVPLEQPFYLQTLQHAFFTHELTEKVLARLSYISCEQDEWNDLLAILPARLLHIQRNGEKGEAIEQEVRHIGQIICIQPVPAEGSERFTLISDIIRYLPTRSTQEIDCLVSLAKGAGSETIRELCVAALQRALTDDVLLEVQAQLSEIHVTETGEEYVEAPDEIPTFLLEPYEYGVPSTNTSLQPDIQQAEQHSGNRTFDICIVCALTEEARAFMHVLTQQCTIQFEKGYSQRNRYGYYHATMRNHRGEPLTIHVSCPPRYGSVELGLHLQRVLEECRPRFSAMTGICAGDKEAVHLGDIVVAERAFTYDTGKFTRDNHGQQLYLHDTITYSPKSEVLQFAQMFDQWEAAVVKIRRRPHSRRQQREWLLNTLLATTGSLDEVEEKILKRHAPDWREIITELQRGDSPYLTQEWKLINPVRVHELRYGKESFPFKDPLRSMLHLKTMASGSAVRADNPFRNVQIPVRGAIAIDMEGATFYRILADFPSIHALLVKGVSDYADADKNDAYHRYAASVAAAYLLSFIQEYVTRERLPTAE